MNESTVSTVSLVSAESRAKPLTATGVFWAVFGAQCAFAGMMLVIWLLMQLWDLFTKVPGAGT